jgi:cell wall-associated NlpC family hydrolase
MRIPRRRLKDRPPVADHGTMAPGGPSRRVRAFGFVVALGIAAMPLGGAPASAGGAGPQGEVGSGPPPIPVVYDRTDRVLARAATVSFSDISDEHAWAATAIEHVGVTHDWMRDFAPNDDGTYPFRPNAIETRKYFARSIVKAFAPDDEPDPAIVFSDVDPSTAWYRYANVAVQRGWMTRTADGAFLPDQPVTMRTAHRGLVLALGLRPAAKALERLHTHDGVTFDTPPGFGTTMLGLRLGLRYNFPSGSESKDVGPADPLPRAYVAYSLFRATTQPSWTVPDLLEQYGDVELPHLGPRQLQLVRWGVRYVGYPYYWGGEWGIANASQSRTGFDCSGLTWWLLRRATTGWEVAPPRPYLGWSLPERTSAEMARLTPERLSFGELRPGDIMFYDGDGNGIVDHVDTYIGNGYALDSSSTPGGVTVMWVGDGWYRDHFVYGRRVLP